MVSWPWLLVVGVLGCGVGVLAVGVLCAGSVYDSYQAGYQDGFEMGSTDAEVNEIREAG
jgi:hypothetical protein